MSSDARRPQPAAGSGCDITGAPGIVVDLADHGSFRPWLADLALDEATQEFTDHKPYAQRLAEARAGTRGDEAVWTGEATIEGIPCALIASDFDFLAGTMGIVAGTRICQALDRAIEQRLPVIGLPSSGGTRMQEGTAAFVQMAAVAAAVRRLRDARLPYLVYLRHPTTGGVLGTWGSLGHLTFAEPGALIGLTGPRVMAALTGAPLPARIQTAEHLHATGVIDAVVPLDQLRAVLATVLAVLQPPPRNPPTLRSCSCPTTTRSTPGRR